MFSKNFTFDPSPSTSPTTTAYTSRPTSSSNSSSSSMTTSRSVSPFSIADLPTRSCSITDLTTQFSSHGLLPQEPYAATDDDAGWTLPTAPSPLHNRQQKAHWEQQHHQPSRSQRQSTARLLCHTAHLRAIERMVRDGVMCDVAGPAEFAVEGFREGEEGQKQKVPSDHRRSSELRGCGVSKSARFRRHERVRSAEK